MAKVKQVSAVTVQQAAQELNVTQNYVRLLCNEGRFGVKIGRQWLISREELDAYKRTKRRPGRPAATPA